MYTFYTSTLKRAQVRVWKHPENVFIGVTHLDARDKMFSEVNVSDDEYPPICKNFNIWHKVASSHDSYQWYARCDDDTFVDEQPVEAHLLQTYPPGRPVYTGLLGRGRPRERSFIPSAYAQGGACEIMNREALETVRGDLGKASRCHKRKCVTPQCHSDVELAQLLLKRGVLFTKTPALSFRMFYATTQLSSTVPIRVDLDNITRDHFPIAYYSPRGRVTFRWNIMHPVKSARHWNAMTDLWEGRTPPISPGIGLCNCTHVPRFILWSTACCNQGIFSVSLPNLPMKCHEDHCSRRIIQCPSTRTPDDLWKRTRTHYAMISVASDDAELLRRRLSAVFSTPVHLFRGSVGKTLFAEGIQSLTSGELGYRETMRRLVSRAIEQKKHLVSFDDDVLMHKNVRRMISDISRVDECTGYLDDPGGVLLLGASEWSKGYRQYVDDSRLCYNAFQRTAGSFAVFASRQVLPFILRWLRASNRPYDHVWEYLQSIGFPVRVANPHLFIANVSKPSTIATRKSAGDPLEFRRRQMAWDVESFLPTPSPRVKKVEL